MKPILLFDIDGTLLRVKREFLRDGLTGILKVHGIQPDAINGMSFAGRTDRDIFTELAGLHQNDDSSDIYSSIKEAYVQFMMTKLDSSAMNVFQGIPDVIHHLREKNYKIGLCTGNYREIAFKKMHTAGFVNTFEFGGFGCHHNDRNHLPGDAHRNYISIFETTPLPQQYVVIGDTPNDIRCARYFGARSIAVATGEFGENQLAACKPDLVLRDLSELTNWLEKI